MEKVKTISKYVISTYLLGNKAVTTVKSKKGSE